MAVLLLLLLTPATTARADWNRAGSLPGLGNGRIWSLAASPKNTNSVIAGTEHGVYHSEDGGTTWKTGNLGDMRVWVVGFDIRNPTHILAGTQEHGVAMSVDGGVTWKDSSAGLPSMNVRSLAFSLSQIAAGTDDGVALSVDGVSWSRSGLRGVSVNAMAVVANAPALTFIAGTDGGVVSQGYLWTNTGTNWGVLRGTGLPASAVVLSIATGPVSQAVKVRPIVINTSQGTFRSLDSGQTWAPPTGLPTVGTEPLPLTVTATSPLDPNLVYSGADAGGSSGGAIMRSTDAGITYLDVAQGLPATNRQVTAIAVTQSTPPTLYIATGPPDAPAVIYKISDTNAPPPPQLVAELPGVAIPAAVATPTPKPTTTATPSATPTPASAGGVRGFVGKMFGWPVPAVYELIALLLIAYGIIRWRQRAYVEGPP